MRERARYLRGVKRNAMSVSRNATYLDVIS
jgi:hypothetical protein